MTEMNTPNQVPQTPQPQQPQQPQVKQPAIPMGAPAQMPPAPGFVPPAGQVPPQHPQPAPMANPMPVAPLTQLTGGMKFGWALVGFLLGPVGILLAWLVNAAGYPAVKSDAIKFSVIGCVIVIVIGILLGILIGVGTYAAMGMMYY